MSVPSNIERLIQGYKVPYSFAEISAHSQSIAHDVIELKPYNAARAIVLKNDEKQMIIAITRTDTLLDIKQVNAIFDSEYQALVGEELKSFMQKCGLSAVPALPGLNNLPTVVDVGLMKYETIYLDVGIGTQYIQLEQANFRQLIGDAKVEDIVTPLCKLEAPSNPEDDIKDIEHSVSIFTERRIKQRLEETLEFPPLPVIAEKIIKLRVDPHADISDLTDIVEIDASLSAQVVSWAASPYYSAPGTIKSIHDAIVRVLGFDMVLNLALGLALGNTLKMPQSGPHGYLPYWQKSTYTAAATEALVTCIPREYRPSFGTAYLAGLLHNFGYLIIAEVFDNQFESICLHMDANPEASAQAVERHIIGVDRNQLAAWLMEFWHMPDTVCMALRHQNDPEYDGEEWQYSLLLYLAQKLLQEQGLGMGVSSEPVSEEVFKRLHIDPEAAQEAIENLLESSEELKMIADQMGD